MKKTLFLGMAALLTLGLASCNGGNAGTDDDGMFDHEPNKIPGETLVVSVVGAEFANWNPAESAKKDSGCVFEQKSTSLYTFTHKVEKGYMFKVVVGGSWSEQYGVEDMDWTKSTKGFVEGTEADYTKGTSDRSNFVSLLDGTMTIEFRPYSFLQGTDKKLIITVK